MTQQNTGYLISRNKSKSEFFISSSAYDRPQWKNLRESTVYRSVELAQHALTKLIKNGLAYEARIVSLEEAMTFDFPNGERVITPNRGRTAEHLPDGNQYPKGDQVTNPGSSDNSDNGGSNDVSDEMKSDDEGGVCPECNHEPCTCENSDEHGHCPACGAELDSGHDEGNGDITEPEGNDELTEPEVEPREPSEFREPGELDYREEEESAFSRAKFARGQSVAYRGAKFKVLADDGTGVAVIAPHGDEAHPIRVNNTALVREATYKTPDSLTAQSASKKVDSKAMPAKPPLDAQPTDNKTTAATYGADLNPVKFKQPAMTGDKVDFGGDDHDVKVKVPAEVMSDLKAKIAEFSKEAEFSNTRDDAKASFLMTASEAMKTILAFLELGTVGGVKQAQISLKSMMSPITNHVPVSVQKFIDQGGKKSTLKDLFDAKRAEKKDTSGDR